MSGFEKLPPTLHKAQPKKRCSTIPCRCSLHCAPNFNLKNKIHFQRAGKFYTKHAKCMIILKKRLNQESGLAGVKHLFGMARAGPKRGTLNF
jgi:hypothetical protein